MADSDLPTPGQPTPPATPAAGGGAWMAGPAAAVSTGGTSRKTCPQCGSQYEPGLNFCPRDGSPLQADHGSLDLIGRMVAGRYQIVRKLGEGGMGQVFLAEHVKLGRSCAIKIMRPALMRDPDAVGRFAREAATAGRITHPNVAAVYDFGETDEGIIYLAMENVEGTALSAVLDARGRFSPAEAVEIAAQVAAGLDAAHEIGIIHRDLKPDNILLAHARDGRVLVKVVDFGIAKAIQEPGQNLTRTGFVVGTLEYMSPEQLVGEPLDGRSDIYSLGCVLYEMLTGRRTFVGPSGAAAALTRRLTEPPPRPRDAVPDVSPALDDVVARALARGADDRYASAFELREALLATLPPAAPRTATPPGIPVAPAAPASAPGPVHTAAPGLPPAAPAFPAGPPAPAAAAPLAASSAFVGPGPHTPAPATPPGPVAAPATAAPVAAAPPPAAPTPEPVPAAEAAPAPAAEPKPRRSAVPWLAAAAAVVVLLAVGAFVVIGRRASRTAQPAAGAPSPTQPAATPSNPPPTGATAANPPAAGSRAAPSAPAPTGQTATATARPTGAPETGKSAGPSTPSSPAPSAPAVAELRLTGTLPAGAVVMLDGAAVSGRTLRLSPGPHTVSVGASGYEVQTWRATVRAGESRTWAPRLQRVAEAPAAALAAAESTRTPAPVEPTPAQPKPAPASSMPYPSAPAPTAPAPGAPSREALVAAGRRAGEALVAAINARDIRQLRRAWPGIRSSEDGAWRRFLEAKENGGLEARLLDVRTEDVNAGTATVLVPLLLTFTNPATGRQTQRPSFEATFVTAGDSWRLATIRPVDGN